METTDHCPLCGQAVTPEQREALEGRLRDEERVRAAASEARIRHELQHEHQRALAAVATGQAAELARQREALQADHDRTLLKAKADANRENERLQKKTKELQRALEKRTANDLGDGQERDIDAELRQAFMPPAGEDAI